MQQKKNLIVFDIDGTLTDTVAMHQSAFKQALQLIGVGEFNDQFGSYKHHTDSHIAKVIYEYSSNRLFNESISQQFENHLYEFTVKNSIAEISGARSLVQYIEKETNIGVCYATGSMNRPAILKLEKIGIDFNPMQLVASNHIEEREGIVEAAIQNAQLHYQVEKFDRIISFGDGLWDLKTANNLSLEFVGVGDVNIEVLKANGMKKHYSDFSRFSFSEFTK